MNSLHSAAVLEIHGDLYAIARRVDQECAAYCVALEAQDTLAAARARLRYRARLREMAERVERLDALLERAAAPAVSAGVGALAAN